MVSAGCAVTLPLASLVTAGWVIVFPLDVCVIVYASIVRKVEFLVVVVNAPAEPSGHVMVAVVITLSESLDAEITE